MTVRALILMTAALTLALSGCGVFRSEEAAGRKALGVRTSAPAASGPSLHSTIPAPNVPADLKARAAGGSVSPAADGRKYTYTLETKSPDAPEVAETFDKVSRLALMIEEPGTMTTLEQRLAVSLDEGRSILQSQGYYDGTVDGRLITDSGDKVRAAVAFKAGPRYKLGPSKVVLAGPLAKDQDGKTPPQSLAEVGLEAGVPAVADDILAAVDRVETEFRNRGYPRAIIEGTRFTIDRKSRTLEAEIHIDPKDFARLGPVIAPEGATVSQSYLDAQRTWKEGQPWNQELVDNYLSALRQSGLFQSVEGGAPERSGAGELLPVEIKLAGAPERTVGGLVSYDTDFGPGLTGYWEHRNLTGHGDRLRIDMPLWEDMQELTATYRYPFFLRPDQDIIARAGLFHQDTDAYKLWSGAAAAGVERRLSRWWKVSAMGSVEGGSLEDPGQDKKEFIMFGLPVAATYDTANSLLDPTRGVRVMMQVAPYTGTFHNDFNVVRTRLEGQAFIPVGTDKFILALRGVWGSLWGADDSQDVPSSLRFYSGGGGSVRGYDYQSVGPRNEKRDPLGGVSQVEMGLETRWRFSETMGLVAFLDGGMVYENVDDKLFQDMLWGAGLGFRYYTPIGPVRLDVAAPLDRRPGDDAWQLYISIGQSF